MVVGIDEKRPGNILVKHESTRGNENVRSYPPNQVVRGIPLKWSERQGRWLAVS